MIEAPGRRQPPTSQKFAMVVSGYPPVRQAGMERGCQRLAAALVQRGHRVSLLTAACPGIMPVMEEDGIMVHRVLRPWALGPLWGLTYRRQVRKWLETNLDQWDTVMCHQLYLHSVEANQVARSTGRRACHLLVAAQSYSDVTRLLDVRGGRWMLRKAVDEADALFVLSRCSRRELEAVGADPSKIHVYRYFVDVNRFTPDGCSPTRELLSLGRWHPQKNLGLLLDAFARLSPASNMRLRIVGAGDEEGFVRSRVARLPFPERVTIEGWAVDPVPLYRRAWALVMSSDAEGLSNVMIEAMACGTPVVTTDVSGAREALDLSDQAITSGEWIRGSGGLLVGRRDVQGVSAALQMLSAEPGLRDELALEARNRVVTAFSENVSLGAFMQVVGTWQRTTPRGHDDG